MIGIYLYIFLSIYILNQPRIIPFIEKIVEQVQDPGQPLVKRTGATGFCWKLSRIGERLSPFVSFSCIFMAVHALFIKK